MKIITFVLMLCVGSGINAVGQPTEDPKMQTAQAQQQFDGLYKRWRDTLVEAAEKARTQGGHLGQLEFRYDNTYFDAMVSMGDAAVPMLQEKLKRFVSERKVARFDELDALLAEAVIRIKRWEKKNLFGHKADAVLSQREIVETVLQRLQVEREAGSSQRGQASTSDKPAESSGKQRP